MTGSVALADGVADKVAWAERHLERIRATVAAYVKSEPLAVSAHYVEHSEPWLGRLPGKLVPRGPGETGQRLRAVNTGGMEPGWVASVEAVRPVPAELPLMVGDFLHNLRSALDHLACGLVLANGGVPKVGGGGTDFPISRDEESKRLATIRPKVSDAAKALLDECQPYRHDPITRSPGYRLREWNNLDKHRGLNVTVAGLSEASAFSILNHDVEPPLAVVVGHGAVFPAGIPVHALPIDWSRDARVEAWAVIDPVVLLEEDSHKQTPPTEPLTLLGHLDELLSWVRDEVVPSFRPCFGEPWPGIFPDGVEA